MSWNRFALGFLLVTLLTYAKSQITNYWVPIEFSYFLIFFILRGSSETRALIFTFLLSLGLDVILQVGLIKGVSAASQLFLIYLIMKLKRNVVPAFHDFFLLTFFAIFYVVNYYLCIGLSQMLGSPFQYPQINLIQLAFLAFFHTAFFGLLLLIDIRRAAKGQSTP